MESAMLRVIEVDWAEELPQAAGVVFTPSVQMKGLASIQLATGTSAGVQPQIGDRFEVKLEAVFTEQGWQAVLAEGEDYITPEPPSQKCECHERDSSYVCEYCRSQGHRGHME